MKSILKRSLEVSNEENTIITTTTTNNNLLSHLMEEINNINENENSNINIIKKVNNNLNIFNNSNNSNNSNNNDDEENNRYQKKRRIINEEEEPQPQPQPKLEEQPQPQPQQQPQSNKNIPFSTPKKPENKFKSFTPFKSRFSISSPINFGNYNNNQNNQNNQNEHLTILKSSNKNKLIKTQVETVHIPESPYNSSIKLKSNKIIPLKLLSQSQQQLDTILNNNNNNNNKSSQQQDNSDNEDDQNDEDDIDKKYFSENDLKNTKHFLISETNSSSSSTSNDTSGGGTSSSNSSINQQFYIGKPEMIVIEIEEEEEEEEEGKQQQQDQHGDDEVKLPFLPIDFSIKSSIQFISSTTFDWCRRSFLTQSFRTSSLQQFLIQNDGQTTDSSSSSSKENLFLKSLMYYSYPQSIQLPWDIDAPVLLHEEYKHFWMKQRWNNWYESFDSLYSSFRENKINYFYLINGIEFSILFLSSTSSNSSTSSSTKVIMNSSTPRIRTLLTREGIIWQTPFINCSQSSLNNSDGTGSGSTTSGGIDISKKLQPKEINIKKKPIDPAYYQTSLSSSQLVIEGFENIDKLYKLLKKKLIWSSDSSLKQQTSSSSSQPLQSSTTTTTLLSSSTQNISKVMFTPKKSRSMENVFINKLEKGHEDEGQEEGIIDNHDDYDDDIMILCKDVPQLLCKNCFIGSTIQINKIISCGPFTKSFQTDKTQLETAFKIEIDGPILPNTSYDLLKLFSIHFNDFQCKQNSLQTTYGFNFNNNSNNNHTIEKSSNLLKRNVIEKIDFINKNTYHITPIG